MPYEYNPEGFLASIDPLQVRDTTKSGSAIDKLSAATDRMQGGLYGLGEAVAGRTSLGGYFRDARLDNQLDADVMDRKIDESGAIRSYKDVDGAMDAARYAGNLALTSAPYMLGIIGGGLVGGAPGALAAGSVLGTSDVLGNQREQAGETNLLTAAPLGAAYGAADALLGIGGSLGRMAATRSLRGFGSTGVSALDNVGAKYLDEMVGMKGVAARAGAAMGKGALTEGITEPFQEGMNQLGRMSVDPSEDFYNERSAEAFRESAIGGALLGGVFGGVTGLSMPRPSAAPLADPNNSVDVLGGQEPLGLRVPTKDFINEHFGLNRTPYAGKDYEKQFEAAVSAPSGNMVPDPETYFETPETAIEDVQRRAGILAQEQALAKERAAAIAAEAERLRAETREVHEAFGVELDANGNPINESARKSVDKYVAPYKNLVELHKSGKIDDAQFIHMAGELKLAAENGATGTKPAASTKAVLNRIEELMAPAPVVEQAAQPATPTQPQSGLQVPGTQAPAPAVEQAAPVAPVEGTVNKAAEPVAPPAPKAPTVTYKRKLERPQQDAATVQPTVETAAPVVPAAPNKPVRTKEDEARFAKLSADRADEVATRVKDNHKATKGTRARLAIIDHQLEKLGEGAKGVKGKLVEKLEAEKAELEQQVNKSLPASAELHEHLKNVMTGLKRPNKQGKVSARNTMMFNRFMAITGMGLDDKGGLYQAHTPKSYGEVAALEGVSKQAVQQSVDRFNISDYALGRIYASMAEKPAAAHSAFEVVAPDAEVDSEAEPSSAPEAGSADSFDSTSDDGLTPKTATEKLTGVNVGSLVQILSDPGYGAATLRSDVEAEDYERAEKSAKGLNQPAWGVVWAQRELDTVISAVEQKEKSAGIDPRKDRSLDDAESIHAAVKARDAWVEKLSEVLKRTTYSAKQQELVLAAVARKVDKRNRTGGVDSDSDDSRDNPAAILPALKILDAIQKEGVARKLGGQAGVDKLREKEAARKADEEKAEAARNEAEAKRDAAFAEKRKAEAQKATMNALAKWATTSAGANAAADWDFYKSEATPSFDNLPAQAKIEWLLSVYKLEEHEQNDQSTIKDLQRSFERGSDSIHVLPAGTPTQKTDAQGVKGRTGEDTAHGLRSGDDSTGPKLSESRPTEKPTKVENRERASDAETKLASFPVEVQEAAEAKWDNDYSEGLPWSKLTEAEQGSLAEAYQADQIAEDNYEESNAFQTAAEGVQDARAKAEPEVKAKGKEKADKAAVKYSKAKQSEGSDAAAITKEISAFMRLGSLGNKVVIVQSVSDLPTGIQRSVNPDADVQGFVVGGKAYLVADNIAPGKARAVFMHEVGSHLGLENLLGNSNYAALVAKVKQWAANNDSSQESKLAQAAQQRVTDAGTDATQSDTELLAYFVEEAVAAGVDPTATKSNTEFGRWFRTLWAAFKTAMHKLGVNPDKLTAQNVVDMAYGAAKLESTGAFHGTAAKFRRFDHKYMGSGEGAQAFGWGSYFAQAPGIAKGYFTKDVAQKNQVDATGSLEGALMRVDFNIADDEWLDLDKPLGKQSEKVQKALEKLRAVLDRKEVGEYASDTTFLEDYLERKNADWDELTGRELIGTYERPGLLPYAINEGVSFGDLGADGEYYKAASEYLDSIGIKGSAFLDANSRDRVALEQKLRSVERSIENIKNGTMRRTSLSGEDWLAGFEKAAEDIRAKLSKPATFNRVVFNDKNIQRVSSMTAADRNRVSFSKAAPIKGNPAAAALTPRWQSFIDNAKATGNWALVRGMLTTDLIGAASKVLDSAPKYLKAMNDIIVERTKAERDVGVVVTDFKKLSTSERAAVNALLMKSTMSKKWAFSPDWVKNADGTSIKADEDMAKEFRKISDKAQEVIKQVFKHGYETMTAMQTEVNKNVASEYDAVIAQLEVDGDTEGAKREKAKKAKSLQDFQTLLNQRAAWPYAPLRRFGNHVVMAMSKEYLAAKDANDSKRMQELEKDGNHYQVAFAENRAAAAQLKAQMEAVPAFAASNGGYADNFERLSQADSMMGGRDMLSAFRRLRNMASDSMEGEGAKAREGVDNAMRQLYLQLLAESSARKGEMNRRNVVGADTDMMRAFATNGRSTAHFIANLKMGSSVDDALASMQKEVKVNKPGREERQRYFNEIMKRHTMGLVYDPSPFVDKALATSSYYMLLSNPSYFIVNAVQPWMMSVPTMGGRFGLGKAASAMAKAYGEVWKVRKDVNGTADLDSEFKLPDDVKAAVTDLAERGIISIELEHELGKFESDGKGKVGDAVEFALGKVRGAAQFVETYNRLTTAIAAYRLAKGSGMAEKAATDYAASVINDTHGDYNGFNYPRFMRTDLGRIVTQFRKFQLIQISLYTRLIRQAFSGATPAEKTAAQWALAYNTMTLAAVGGASALPIGLAATVALAVVGDDDEPNDPRAFLIKQVGQEWADLLYGGVSQAVGVPLGERLGAGQMLSLLPYTDLSLTKDGFNGLLRGLSGPLVGGVVGKMWEGMGLFASGDQWKGTEMMLPTGVANFMKAYRFFNEGVTNRNGDVLIAPDALSGGAIFGQAIGAPTSTIKDRMANAASVFESDTFYKNRTSEIKRGYTEAVRSGDTEATAELRDKWNKLQEARVRNGYKKQPLSELLKAPQEQRKREARTSGGVQYRDSNKGAVEALTAE